MEAYFRSVDEASYIFVINRKEGEDIEEAIKQPTYILSGRDNDSINRAEAVLNKCKLNTIFSRSLKPIETKKIINSMRYVLNAQHFRDNSHELMGLTASVRERAYPMPNKRDKYWEWYNIAAGMGLRMILSKRLNKSMNTNALSITFVEGMCYGFPKNDAVRLIAQQIGDYVITIFESELNWNNRNTMVLSRIGAQKLKTILETEWRVYEPLVNQLKKDEEFNRSYNNWG